VRIQIFNLRLDAVVCGVFMGLVALIVCEASRAWLRAGRRPAPRRSRPPRRAESMALTAVTLREIERIFEILDRLGISREAVVIR